MNEVEAARAMALWGGRAAPGIRALAHEFCSVRSLKAAECGAVKTGSEALDASGPSTRRPDMKPDMKPESSLDSTKPATDCCDKGASAGPASCAQETSTKGDRTKDANRDPISGQPGAHAVGVGLGAVGAGAAAGAVGGAVGGPVGMVAGAVIGAVAGGVVGKAAAEVVNPTTEEKYWRDTYASRPYANNGGGYDHYASAYKYGWESAGRNGRSGQTFESVEGDLGRGWDVARGTSPLAWNQARDATRDAWNRVATSGEQRRV
jgi:hypothetical protein